MKRNKLIPAALSLMLVLALAACGGTPATTPAPATPTPGAEATPAPTAAPTATPSAEGDGSLQRVLDAGVLTVGAEGNWIPYVYNKDVTGDLTGFEVEIAREVASRLGVEVQFQIADSWDPVLAGLEGGLFSNVAEGFTDADGAVYAMPMCIRVPLLAGDGEAVRQMSDLECVADQAEQLRMDHPQGGIFGIHDPETMLRLFGMVSASAWIQEDGQIDQPAVEEFLRQVKRIYDAEESGMVPEQAERLAEEAEEMASYGTDPVQYRMEACNNVLDITRGYAMAAGGFAEGIQLCLDNITSVLRLDEGLDYRLFSGQAEAPFLPSAMVGISSRTGQQAEAEEFVRLIFSAETQEHIYEGFPVNRAAFEARFDVSEENSYNGSMTLPMADGTERELTLYWPDQAERERFTGYVESLKTPVLADGHLCELVYETGKKVLEGGLSAEDGAAEIVKKASIYLAE